MIPLDERHRVMIASSNVQTTSCREAAILGGIVRCKIAANKYNGPWIAQYASDIIGSNGGFNLVGVDRSPPNMAEIAMVLDRFKAATLALGSP